MLFCNCPVTSFHTNSPNSGTRVEGFEPPNGETKTRCLTAWPHPICTVLLKGSSYRCKTSLVTTPSLCERRVALPPQSFRDLREIINRSYRALYRLIALSWVHYISLIENSLQTKTH